MYKPKKDDELPLPANFFEVVGLDIALSKSGFPTAYGKALRNIASNWCRYTATKWKVFMLQVGPIVLLD